MTRPTTFRIIALGGASLMLAGCATAPTPATGGDGSVTVSSCGVDYAYTAAPERVLLGYPGTIDTLEALGVADRAIGYTLADDATDQQQRYPGLTETTADWTPSREFILAAQPDLFLSNDEQQLTGDGAASLDDLASVPGNLFVLGDYCIGSVASSTIDGVYDDITDLGAIFRVEERAAQLIDELSARVDAAAALNTAASPLSAAVVTINDGTVYALSGANYATIPAALGLENVWNSTENFSEVSSEIVLATAPDVILVTYSGGDVERDAALADARDRFRSSPAAVEGRIVALPEDGFSSGGIAIVDLIETAAHAIFR